MHLNLHVRTAITNIQWWFEWERLNMFHNISICTSLECMLRCASAYSIGWRCGSSFYIKALKLLYLWQNSEKGKANYPQDFSLKEQVPLFIKFVKVLLCNTILLTVKRLYTLAIT